MALLLYQDICRYHQFIIRLKKRTNTHFLVFRKQQIKTVPTKHSYKASLDSCWPFPAATLTPDPNSKHTKQATTTTGTTTGVLFCFVFLKRCQAAAP